MAHAPGVPGVLTMPSSHDAPTLDVSRAVRDGLDAVGRNVAPWSIGVLGLVIGVGAAMMMCGLPVFFVGPVLAWGWYSLVLRGIDGTARLEDFGSGFDDLGQSWLGMLGVQLALFLADLPGQTIAFVLPIALSLGSTIGLSALSGQGGTEDLLAMIAANQAAAFVGWFVVAAWQGLVVSRLMLAPFLLVDRPHSIGDAISGSWALTKPVWPYWGALVGGGALVQLLAASFCFFPWIPAYVVVSGIYGTVYRQLVPRHDAGPAQEAIP